MAEATAKKKVYSPIKTTRNQERRRMRNRSVTTRIKNTFKAAVASSLEESNADDVKTAYSAIDKALAKGVNHKNKAARRKSRLMKKIATVKAEAAEKA